MARIFQKEAKRNNHDCKGTRMTQTTSAAGGGDSSLMDRVRTGATSQLTTQKSRVTDGLNGLASAVRQSTNALRENQQTTSADFVERAAGQIEQIATRLRERDVNDLLRDAQQFARRQPAIFVGAAFAAGVLAARFVKSSSTNQFGNTPTRRGGSQPVGTLEGTAGSYQAGGGRR
jgi:hypothetical protein